MLPLEARSYLSWFHKGMIGICLSAAVLKWVLPGGSPWHHYQAIFDLLSAAVGGGLILYGFTVLHEKRLVEDVPASKVRSVAMGLAEVKGAARTKAPLASPITGLPCVYYRYLIEEERSGSRGNDRWVTIDKGESTQPFYVEDETGRILVDPSGAETILRQDYRSIQRDGGWLSKRRRYTEWHLVPGERVYVLGTVSKTTDVIHARRAQITERLQQLKRDQARMKEFDTDGDGQISPEEWEHAVEKTKEDLLREEMSRQTSEPPEDDLVVGKGSAETTFVIADRSEASIARMLSWKAGASLLFGPAIVIVIVVSLLARSGVFPAGWAIPWESLLH